MDNQTALNVYLASMSSFTLLNKDAEYALAKQIKQAEKDLIAALLECPETRTFIATSANEFTLGRLRGSQIFENRTDFE